MIDSGHFITDAQLDAAYTAGRGQTVGHADVGAHRAGCRAVAEMAVAAFVAADYRSTAPAMDRIAKAVDRLSNTLYGPAEALLPNGETMHFATVRARDEYLAFLARDKATGEATT